MERLLILDPLASDAATDAAGCAARVREADPAEPSILAFDAGVARGDGVFETLGVNDGIVRGVEAHVRRLAASARLLDLPEPHEGQWADAVRRMTGLLPSDGAAAIRLVLTRGVPGAGPSAWLTGQTTPEDVRERVTGVRVVLLDRGQPVDVAVRAPWALAGAKTLSYAANMAAIREARRRGADDVVYVSSDGFALEGPSSSLILRERGRFITPSADDGILQGTTQRAVFSYLETLGHETASERVAVSRVREADAAWLVSSVRLAVPVTAIDGRALDVDADLTAAVNARLLAG